MGHVIPEMNTHVWKALDRFLQKYYDLLQRRCVPAKLAFEMDAFNKFGSETHRGNHKSYYPAR